MTKHQKTTYTKKMISWVLGVGLFDMQLPFVLAFLDKQDIAETLGITIATEIVAVIVGYLLKSFYETKSEKYNELSKYKFDTIHKEDNCDE